MTVLVPVPDHLAIVRRLVLDGVSSPITRAMYGKALDDFFQWWEGQGRPAFSRATVQAHRAWLEEKAYAPSTVNQRLAAIKKLAREAAANGWLSQESAMGIVQVPGAKQQGTRSGNWLTSEQAQQLINTPDGTTLKGKRDRAILALLVGCGLRRAEAIALTLNHLQQREGRWVLIDMRGKHGRIRTVPVPAWVKAAVQSWTNAAGITEGPILRSINRRKQVASSFSAQGIFAVVKEYGGRIGLQITPHDLRRTCAKLCRAGGGELEQIQLLLGHESIQTTERYLGMKQNLAHAPNDRIPVGWIFPPD